MKAARSERRPTAARTPCPLCGVRLRLIRAGRLPVHAARPGRWRDVRCDASGKPITEARRTAEALL